MMLLAFIAALHRARAAPLATGGHPPLDRRFADRASSTAAFFFAAVEREIQRVVADRPPVRPADDGPRRPQGDQRPLRPFPRRPGAAGGGAGHQDRRPTDRHGRPLRRRRVRRPPARNRTRRAPTSWPRRSARAWRSSASPGPGLDIRTSLSIGAVAYPDDGLTADDLLISADRAMYVSKRQGKNRVVGYTPAGGHGRRPSDDEL